MNNIRPIGEKITIFAGALAITHGVLNADSNTFCVGMIMEAAGITSIQCNQLNKINNNKRLLIQTMYHKKGD